MAFHRGKLWHYLCRILSTAYIVEVTARVEFHFEKKTIDGVTFCLAYITPRMWHTVCRFAIYTRVIYSESNARYCCTRICASCCYPTFTRLLEYFSKKHCCCCPHLMWSQNKPFEECRLLIPGAKNWLRHDCGNWIQLDEMNLNKFTDGLNCCKICRLWYKYCYFIISIIFSICLIVYMCEKFFLFVY